MGPLKIIFMGKCLGRLRTVTASWGRCFTLGYKLIKNVNKHQATAKTTSKHYQVNVQSITTAISLQGIYFTAFIPNSEPPLPMQTPHFPDPKVPAAPKPCGRGRTASRFHQAFQGPGPAWALFLGCTLKHSSLFKWKGGSLNAIHSCNKYLLIHHLSCSRRGSRHRGCSKEQHGAAQPWRSLTSKQNIGGTPGRAPYPTVGTLTKLPRKCWFRCDLKYK